VVTEDNDEPRVDHSWSIDLEMLPKTHDGSGCIMLKADRLCRVVGDKVLVRDASFEVRAGEILAILGPSGSGKTSLLRLLNRLDEPTSGTVFLQGFEYRAVAPRELRRRVGMVTQRPYLFPGSVAENVNFGPSQRGELLPPDSIEQLLAKVGLSGYSIRDTARLSGGEAQRVSLARTLANSPSVLLLDEPTSALDQAAKSEIEFLIQKIVRDDGLSCVIVTHDITQAARIADRVLLLERGGIVKIGPVNEVLHA
jgi:putative ABC transport system ATP-binding protein